MNPTLLDAQTLKNFINTRITTPVNESWLSDEGETIPYTNAEQEAYNNLFLMYKPDPNYEDDF